jgi:hypothetical protein
MCSGGRFVIQQTDAKTTPANTSGTPNGHISNQSLKTTDNSWGHWRHWNGWLLFGLTTAFPFAVIHKAWLLAQPGEGTSSLLKPEGL